MADIVTSYLDIGDNRLVLTDAAAQGALETKANIDGSYDTLTAGDAKQLLSTVGITDKVPYNFRTSGGSADIGDRLTDKVVGGTIAWNQLVNPIGRNVNTLTVTVTNGKYNVSGTASSSGGRTQWLSDKDINVISGHKYGAFLIGDTADLRFFITNKDDTSVFLPYFESSTVLNATTEGTYNFGFNATNGATYNCSFYFMCIDLTQMFGSAIADYIYSLEQSTAGAGVAWFKKLFPKDYYEYNAGELMSVQTSSHDTVGFNAWDEEWEVGNYSVSTGEKISQTDRIRSKNMIPCLPSTSYFYQVSVGNMVILFYDGQGNYLSYYNFNTNHVFQTPQDCRFISFFTGSAYGTTYNHDICINLSWDGERDGEYEPYVKHTYPLDSDLVLRGIPKLDASNSLYYDGDTYESDGTVTRRYGVVDLGTPTWSRLEATSGVYRFRASTPSVAGNAGSTIANMMCTKYPAITGNETYTGTKVGISGYSDGGYIFVYDPIYTDAASFKTAMSGVMLVYELATPTAETADPYQNPQIVDDFGTEEYVDAGSRDVTVPVGHETFYAANLKAKLEMSPDSPSDGDGDYIVRQTNGNNEYVKMVKELPSAPTSDGTYHLKVTVASGTPTLTWEEDT